VVGDVPGGGRRRDRSGGAASARAPAKCRGQLIHEWAWKLGWVLGRSSELFVSHKREWRGGCTTAVAMADGGEMLACAKRKGGFYRRRHVERRFSQLSSSTGGHGMGAKAVADMR
jgi:hypothetical protein